MADNTIFYQTQPFAPINNRATLNTKKSLQLSSKTPGKSNFAGILEESLSNVKFSQHALERLKSRNLHFNEEDLLKLNEAVDKIAQKGARESLVYLNDVAMVVSVKNRTVITAMDGKSAKDTIFTNIDSAVIL